MKQFPQLRMRHSLADIPQRRELPAGCSLRPAKAEDAVGVAAVLHASFQEVNEVWDAERVVRELLDDPSVPTTYLIERDGVVVATASYQVKEEPDPAAGWVHWVGVHPDARGLGLGEVASHRVLEEAVARGRSCAYLTTDDFRLAAIRIYLNLGFEADCWHENHASRWEEIGRILRPKGRGTCAD